MAFTPDDAYLVSTALREQAKAQRRLAGTRPYVGPMFAAGRAKLREQAKRLDELAASVASWTLTAPDWPGTARTILNAGTPEGMAELRSRAGLSDA